MKVLIIDNEEKIRTGLKKMLYNNSPQITEVFQANGVKDGIEAIRKVEPDLVFLDVEMDDGTGMELLERLGNIDFQIIFITAHNKYAIDAFKFSAIDFLLKPIDEDDLAASISKAAQNIKTKNIAAQLQILQQSLSSIKNVEKKIVLKDSESIHFVRVTDIIRCESEGPYTTFFLIDNSRIVISKTLKEYEELLQDYGFIRIHHSHLVSSSKIIRFDKGDGGFLILENGDVVPVSQRKKEHVMEILKGL